MAKKRSVATPSNTVSADPALQPPVDTPGDGPLQEGKFIAIDVGGGGTYEIHPVAEGDAGRERYIQFGGRTYEHVGVHRGVWAYRHLG